MPTPSLIPNRGRIPYTRPSQFPSDNSKVHCAEPSTRLAEGPARAPERQSRPAGDRPLSAHPSCIIADKRGLKMSKGKGR